MCGDGRSIEATQQKQSKLQSEIQSKQAARFAIEA